MTDLAPVPLVRNASAVAVRDFWKGIDLESKRTVLEAHCDEVANFQEASLQSRKNLSSQTKEFRKLPDDGKLQAFGALLKLYQEEVDRLTKRSKFAEQAFSSLYKDLHEAPDPVITISSLLEDLEKTMETVRQHQTVVAELEEYRSEFQYLKNQDASLRRLEDKIKAADMDLEAKIAQALEQQRATLEEEFAQNNSQHRQREVQLAEQLESSKATLENVQRAFDAMQSEAFESRQLLEEDAAAKASQIDLLSSEVERMTVLISSLEREKEELNRQYMTLWKSQGGSTPSDKEQGQTRKEMEATIRHQEERLAAVVAQATASELALSIEQGKHNMELDALRKTVEEQEARLAEQHQALSSAPSWDLVHRLKEQLKLLQYVQFNGHTQDDDALEGKGQGVDSLTAGSEGDGEVQRLEVLLSEKNRQLEGKLSDAKGQLGALEEELASCKAALVDLQSKDKERDRLLAQLEQDLDVRTRCANSSSSGLASSGPVNNDVPEGTSSTPSTAWKFSLESSAVLPFKNNTGVGEDSPTPPSSSGSRSLLEIVSEQRDRFRAKILRLEEEVARVQKLADEQRNEVSVMRQDNVKLYEKIKYMQTYTANERAEDLESGTSSSVRGRGTDDSDLVVRRYQKLYEDGINPFRIFNQKEEASQYKNLTAPEKVMLNMSRVFLANPFARKFLFFYLLLLHLLVFFTLSSWSWHKKNNAC